MFQWRKRSKLMYLAILENLTRKLNRYSRNLNKRTITRGIGGKCRDGRVKHMKKLLCMDKGNFHVYSGEQSEGVGSY